MFSEIRKRVKKKGQPPGTAKYTGEHISNEPVITVIHYSKHDFYEYIGANLDDVLPKKHEEGITWVSIEGLHDSEMITQLTKKFDIHPLTVEDILNIEQRPKVEEFDNYIFITLKMLLWHPSKSNFSVRQLSIILGKNFVLSFQELNTKLFDNIHKRLKGNPTQPLRQHGSDYLTYRLIDAVVDEYFIVLEALGNQIEKTEELIIAAPTPTNSRTIYRLKRQMLLLRKAIWPMREAISHLIHVDDHLISKYTSLYLRDVYDHAVQAIDSVETFREMLSSMLDMYLSSLTNRMNEIMKTLTIITTIFIPITSIASIYGMNFHYMPELQWRYGYPFAIGIMLLIAILMLIYFKRKKWI